MKIFFCVFLLVAAVYGKRELKVSNYCKNYVINSAGNVYDEKRSGPVDGNSVLHLGYVTHEESKSRDPFDVTFHFSLSKYVVFGYVPLPQGIHDQIGRGLAGSLHGKYLGKSNLKVPCPWKRFPGSGGHCGPSKGAHNDKIALRPFMADIKKSLGSLAPLASGWFRAWVSAKTSYGKNALCVFVEVKLNLN